MNEHSSLVFPAHLLIKQPLGQPHTPSYPPLCFFNFLSYAPPSGGLLTPSLQPRPPAPSARVGRSLPGTLLLAGMLRQASSARHPPTGNPIGEHRDPSPHASGMGHACTETPSATCSSGEGHCLPDNFREGVSPPSHQEGGTQTEKKQKR